jgi:long-chain acyl-CoA synthetase
LPSVTGEESRRTYIGINSTLSNFLSQVGIRWHRAGAGVFSLIYGTEMTDLWNGSRLGTGNLHRVLVSAPEGNLTGAELLKVVEHLSVEMEQIGIRQGDLVGLMLPNSLAFVSLFLSLSRIGARVALLSPKLRVNAIDPILGTLYLRYLITPEALLREQNWLSERSISVREIASTPSNGSCVLTLDNDTSPIPENVSLIKFSSGSTGEPKGIGITVDNLIAEATNITETLLLTPESHVVAPVPVSHSYGFDLGMLACMWSGARLTLQDAFVPRHTLRTLTEGPVDVFLGVPPMYSILLDTPLNSVPDLSGVRYLLSCTAPLSADVIRDFFARFRAPICQHYGSSETGAVSLHVPEQVLQYPGSVGRAMKNVTITIDGRSPDRPDGQGEVVVRSAAVAETCVMGSPEGKAALQNGEFRTGDLGSLDQRGFLFVHGRADALINVGGLKVSPAEVVQVLERHPSIREAAVVGVRSARDQEIVYAVVALRSAATEEQLLRFCRSRLAEYKVPRRIEFREALPRGPSGKIHIRPGDVHS